MSFRRVDRAVLLAFVIVVVVLGANWVAVRFSNRELPPFWGAALRFFIASAILFGIVAWRRIPVPTGRAMTGAVLWGALVFGATFALLYWALVAVPAGMTSVIFATLPLMTLFVAAAAGLERITRVGVAGAVVALGGLALIFNEQLTAAVPMERVAAILLGAVVGAFAGVLVKGFPRTHPIATNAIGTGVGAVLLLIASLALGEERALPQRTPTWLALGYLVFSTTLGFVLVVFVTLRWTATASSYAAVLSPIVTVIVATAIGGEVFGPVFFLGAAIVGAGVYLGTLVRAGAGPTTP